MYQKKLLSEKIEENIVDLIVKGFFKPGDKLPNELQLSEELNISRATLREAIKTLESRNVLEVRRGIGTFIAQVPGLSKNPLGSEFIDLSSNPTILFSTIQFQAYQMMSRMKAISPHDLNEIMDTNMVLKQGPIGVEGYYDIMLNALEAVAKILEDELSFRLLIVMHQLLTEFLDSRALAIDGKFRSHMDAWQVHFRNKEVEPLKMTFNEIVTWTLEKVV